MTVIQKTIGRLPVNLGDYDSTRAYGKKNRVLLYGCEWESKVNNNTYAPAALNTTTGVITQDTTHWKLISGSYNTWLIDNGYQKMDATNVKDGNNNQHQINASFANEIGSDSTPESIKGRITNLEEAVGSGGSVDERIAEEGARHYLKSETYTKSEVNGMITTPDQEYVTVTATDQTTAVTDVLPATGEPDTVYRVGNWDGNQYDATAYSEYAWNESTSQYIHLSTKPQIGEVFDISAYHATGGTLATYADLSTALDSNNGGGVPQSLQRGGMSVKFVHTSDNKYIQCRLLSDSFNTTVSNWLMIDNELCVKTQAYAVSGVYLEEDTTNLKVFFTYNGGLVLRGSISKDSTTISNLATALGVSLVTSTKGVQSCIAIEDSKSVVYNIVNKTFELIDRSLIKPYHIIILSQANGKLLQWNQSIFPSNATLYNSVEDNKSDISYISSSIHTQVYTDKSYIECDNANGKLYFTYNGGIRLRGASYKDSITVSQLASGMGKTLTTSPKGKENCIVLDDSECLVYNIKNDVYEIIGRQNIKPFHVVILSNVYGRPVDWNLGIIDGIEELNNLDTVFRGVNVFCSDDVSSPKIEEDKTNGKVYFTFSGALYIRGTAYVDSITISNLATTLGISLVTSPQGLSNCIEISSYTALVYDLINSTYKLKEINSLLSTDIVILEAFEGSAVYQIPGLTYGGTTLQEVSKDINTQKKRANVFCSSDTSTYYEEDTDNNKVYFTYSGNIYVRGTLYVDSISLQRLAEQLDISLVTSPDGKPNCIQFDDYEALVYDMNSALYKIKSIGNLVATDFVLLETLGGRLIYTAPGMLFYTSEVDIEKRVAALEADPSGSGKSPIYTRNAHRLTDIVTGCRLYDHNHNKDVQFAICTDVHADDTAIYNSIDALKDFDTLDAVINCGDFVADIYRDGNSPTKFNEFVQKLSAKHLSKPYLYVIGNHDVGNSKSVRRSSDHEETYNSFIKYMDDLGYFENGEHPSGKCYYYKDFAPQGERRGIRFIALYEYDNPIDFDETYWKAIPYDNTLSLIQGNTSYAVGNKVNIYSYEGHSFECVQACTTDSAMLEREVTFMPKFKTVRGWQIFGQEQLNWFVNTLYSTPNGYDVCIALHQEFSQSAKNQTGKLFADKVYEGNDIDDGQHYMGNDIIAKIVNAYNSRTILNEKVWYTGDASIYNVLNDGTINYAFEEYKDFSSVNTDSKVLCFLGGHWHSDMVLKHNSYNIWQIIALTAHSGHYVTRTGISTTSEDGTAKDCITCVAFDGGNSKLRLSKIGCTRVDNGDNRDYEVIEL